ncbi:M16 family metallopeptidase [Pontibacter cellulosilyticus]|uniref:Insulinase family protein n=1 Tax=Pontibacter cellulosilyticus TaxID=1720253 RepID=A0A923N7V4_9BACT|nr:pitrilysin family protein [Pontibacter cellulosilyticus]MBC5993828.1 insulinase family protein [Pontibacter cellulosilyticus]
MLDRTKAPEIHEIDAVTLQIAEVTNLDNGVRLHSIISETQPVIRLDFVFKAGKWYEEENGVSDLSSKMLLEGTTNLTAKQIAEKVAFYGASLDINHGYDRTEITLYCLAKYIGELLPIVIDVLENPSFPESEFDLLKQRSQQNLKVQRQKNSYLATHAFTKQIYGNSHPYIFGYDEQDLDKVDLTKAKEFYKKNFISQELEVFACGAVDKVMHQQLTSLINKLKLNRANSGVAGSEGINREKVALPVKNELVEMPESLQSSIRIGKQFPMMTSNDYQKLLVMNEIFGGYFGSRLMKNIREDKGYTYGIYSAISPKEHDTLFFIGTDVKSSVTEDTINEVMKEISLLQNELVPEEELETVKNYMLGKFLNDIATIFEQADRYKRIVLNNLPQNFYNSYVATVRNITTEEIQQLAQQYLQEKDLHIVVAGKYS